MGVLALASLISFVLSFIIKEDLKRLRYAEKQAAKDRNRKRASDEN